MAFPQQSLINLLKVRDGGLGGGGQAGKLNQARIEAVGGHVHSVPVGLATDDDVEGDDRNAIGAGCLWRQVRTTVSHYSNRCGMSQLGAPLPGFAMRYPTRGSVKM